MQIEQTDTAATLAGAGLVLGILANLLAWVQGPAVSGFAVWVSLFAILLCIDTVRRETANFPRLRTKPEETTNLSQAHTGPEETANFLQAQTGQEETANLLPAHTGRGETVNLPHVLLWSLVACLAALVLTLRSAPIFIPAMWLLLLLAAVMLVVRHWQPASAELRVHDLFRAGLLILLRLLFGLPLLLANLNLQGLSTRPQVLAVLRGLLFTLPLLLVFMALFASADATFDRFGSFLTAWLSEEFLAHLLRTGLFVWLNSGLLAALRFSNAGTLSLPELKPCLGKTETTMVLGTLALLFIAFVSVQLGYLFGGKATIEASTGLTVAAYARRGFYELLTVAMLTLTLLLGMAAISRDQRRFRQLALILVACVLLIQVSAVQRLVLYIDEFGLSLDRVIASTVMAWLCVVLLAFALTVLRAKPRWFIQASVTTGVLAALLCALMNPAALVASVNIERSVVQQKPLDLHYLLSLGADAVPALVQRIEALPEAAQCNAAQQLLPWAAAGYPGTDPALYANDDGIAEPSRLDWRHFHLGRWLAHRAVTEHQVLLQQIIERKVAAVCPG